MTLLSRKYSKEYQDFKLHDSIKTLPMIKWIDMRSSGDFRHLLYEYKEDISQKEFNTLEGAYYSIMDEFWDTFGQDEQFKETLKKKLQLHNLNLEIIKTGNRFLLNEKNLLEKDVYKEIEKNIDVLDSKKGMQKEFAVINKEFNAGMSILKTTVLEFYINREALIK